MERKSFISLMQITGLVTSGWLFMCDIILAQNLNGLDEEGHAIEEIIVTGSRIARQDFTSVSPLVTLDELELKLSGATNLEEALNVFPQVIPDLGRTSNNPQLGPQSEDGLQVARINLRGLGTKRTLVMLNNRRFAPSGISGSIDINSLPSALIKRVEIITGGASAVYGSDAVTGVVNFILDDKFDGIEIDTQFDITGKGDGEVYDVNLTYGLPLDNGRGHVTVFGGYQKRTPIFWDERDFTAVLLLDDPETGEIYNGGSPSTPSGWIPFPPAIIDGMLTSPTFNADGTPRAFVFPDDLYNFAPDTFLQMPLERWSASTYTDYAITPTVNVFTEFMFTRNDVSSGLAPVTMQTSRLAINTDNPVLAPEARNMFETFYDTDGDGIASDFLLFRRLTEKGARRFKNTRDSYRFLGGIDAEIFSNWQGQIYYSYSETDGKLKLINNASLSRLQQGLLVDPLTGQCFDPSGGCVALNIFGAGNLSSEGADFIHTEAIINTTNVREQIVQGTLTGKLMTLPAGILRLAAGAEWRELKSEFRPDPGVFSGDVLGLSIVNPAQGKVTVKEIFAETLIPLLSDKPFIEHLEIEAGVRVSDYSGSGVTSTWKAGGKWSPTPALYLRGMFQRAVRSPNIEELFREQSDFFGFTGFWEIDNCSASKDPIGNGLTDVCIAQGLASNQVGVFEAQPTPGTIFSGGNPELEPENSESITVGAVFQPEILPGFSASLDYYSINIDNAIVNLGDRAISTCFMLKDPNAEICRLVRRGLDGNINEIDFIERNITVLKTEGIDLQVRYQFDAPELALLDGGTLITLQFTGTHVLKHGVSAHEAFPIVDCAGYFGSLCANTSFGTIPKFRTTTRLTYNSGPFTASLNWRWIDSVKNSLSLEETGLLSPVLAIPSVGDEHYLDLSFNFDIRKNLSIDGGIINVLDNDPPLLAGQQTDANTDPSTYDVIGRRFFMGLSLRF